MLEQKKLLELYHTSIAWLMQNVFVTSTLIQIGIVLLVFILAYFAAKKPKSMVIDYLHKRFSQRQLDRYNEEALINLITPLLGLIFLWMAANITIAIEMRGHVISIVAKLLTAWIVIRLTSSIVRYPAWSKMIASIAWFIAALSILGLLTPTVNLLDSLALTVGELRISAFTVIKGVFWLFILLWLANSASRLIERRIRSFPHITPSVKVLLSKMTKLSLIVLALLIALNSLGIDLTVITVFGGAIGLGLGFGLQKVVSNLVCGVILLLDRSVKPGDVVEVGDTFGWVNNLGSRNISVITRDGVEHLIPNEQLITEKVVNWSYSTPNVRLKIPVGISYSADVNNAMELMVEAAKDSGRVLSDPPPVCRFVAFGDSAIELELRVWIADPPKGVGNVRSEVLLSVWNKFKEHNIEVPFPQRDITLKPSSEMESLIRQIIHKELSAKG